MPMAIPRFAFAVLLATCGASAHAGGDLHFTTPHSAITVARGSVIAVPIHIENAAAEASDATSVNVARLHEGWSFAMGGAPGCGQLHDTADAGVLAFDIPSLPPAGALDCSLTLSRSTAAIDDLRLQVWSEIGFRVTIDAIAGTFADIALDSDLVSLSVDANGVAHGLFRLTARNIGNVAIGAFDAMTCTYDRTFDNAIEGGCATTTSQCARGMVPYAAQGARLPAIAPGEQTSCLLQVHGAHAIADTLRIDQDPEWDVWLIDAATGGRVYDANAADNSTAITAAVGGGGSGTPSPAPTLSPLALALLGAGMLWIAARVSRRHGLRRQ